MVCLLISFDSNPSPWEFILGNWMHFFLLETFLYISSSQNYNFGQIWDQVWCCNWAFWIKSSSCPHDHRGTMAINTLGLISAPVIVLILINAFRANIGWIMMTLPWILLFHITLFRKSRISENSSSSCPNGVKVIKQIISYLPPSISVVVIASMMYFGLLLDQ